MTMLFMSYLICHATYFIVHLSGMSEMDERRTIDFCKLSLLNMRYFFAFMVFTMYLSGMYFYHVPIWYVLLQCTCLLCTFTMYLSGMYFYHVPIWYVLIPCTYLVCTYTMYLYGMYLYHVPI